METGLFAKVPKVMFFVKNVLVRKLFEYALA